MVAAIAQGGRQVVADTCLVVAPVKESCSAAYHPSGKGAYYALSYPGLAVHMGHSRRVSSRGNRQMEMA
jgi:predicted aconitase